MKKVVSIVLSIAIMLSLSAQLMTFAVNTVDVSVDNTVEALQGAKSVEIPVYISSTPVWSAISFSFSFDAKAFTFKSFKLNPELQRQMLEEELTIFAINDTDAANGNINAGFTTASVAGGYEGYYPGEYDYFGAIVVDVDSDATPDEYTFDITVSGVKRINGSEYLPSTIPFTAADGSVTVLCDHTWGAWQVTTPATCSQKGVETRYCSKDNAHFETRDVEIDPDAHDWTEWETTANASCISKETQTRHCKNNVMHIETREVGEIDADAHDWGAWEEVEPATCTEAAVEKRVCKNNPAHFETREGESALNHDWGEWQVTTPATVYAPGEETRYCKNDNSHFETRPIDQLECILGDLDDDKEITVSDALRTLRIAAKIAETDASLNYIADVDKDKDVTVTDALIILRCAVGLAAI